MHCARRGHWLCEPHQHMWRPGILVRGYPLCLPSICALTYAPLRCGCVRGCVWWCVVAVRTVSWWTARPRVPPCRTNAPRTRAMRCLRAHTGRTVPPATRRGHATAARWSMQPTPTSCARVRISPTSPARGCNWVTEVAMCWASLAMSRLRMSPRTPWYAALPPSYTVRYVVSRTVALGSTQLVATIAVMLVISVALTFVASKLDKVDPPPLLLASTKVCRRWGTSLAFRSHASPGVYATRRIRH